MIYRTFTLTDINFLSFKNFQFCCLYVFHKIRISTDTTPNANSLIMLCLLVNFFLKCVYCAVNIVQQPFIENIYVHVALGYRQNVLYMNCFNLNSAKHTYLILFEIAIFISKHLMFNANNLEKIVRKWIFS